MDNPFKAAISVRKPDTVRYDRGLLQSPLRTPPLIREVVRVSANWLTEATLFARRNVGSTSPCFAIRLHTSADLPLMAEYLPNDVWRLISGTFTPKEMHILFSTCKVMQHYLEECIDKVEHQYLTTATDISDIANNHASTPKICTAKLKEFFDKGNCVGISLSTCTPVKGVIAAFAQSKSIELIRINANDIAKVISGKTLACLLDNLDGAAIELSLANNNSWSDLAFKKVFKSIAVNGSVLRLNLDGNNFRTFERSKPFFGMLFGRYSRLCTLSLAGSKFTDSTLSCLSDFGMSLLGFGLRFGLLSRLRSIDLANTSIQRRKMPFPEIGNNLLSDCIHPLAITHSYIDFCRYFLETKEESGLQVIIESLAANSTVTAIYLSHCGIDKKMTKVLAKSLQHNKTLKIIHLAENLIDNKGIKVLAKSIRQHPTLERLSLASNENIEQKGWIDFFTILSGNTSMRQLDLCYCAIGDLGAVALATMLKTNLTLKELFLSNSQINLEGMTALADSLRGHASVKLLDLAGNYIPLKDIALLQHLADEGIQVRVETDIQPKAAKAERTSPEALAKGIQDADAIERGNVWL